MTVSAGRARTASEPQAAPSGGRAHTRVRGAVERALSENSSTVEVQGRRLELPPPDQLAYLAGLGLLTALEIIEWPVAVALALGHELARNRHSRMLRAFGDAMEEA